MKATVSGSFRKAMIGVQKAVYELEEAGVEVLSPADPREAAWHGEFLFVASDKVRSIKLVQERHLQAIAASDFLWLCTANGYVGQSAAMEIGYARAIGTPIYADALLDDLTLREYVTQLENPRQAISLTKKLRDVKRSSKDTSILLEPALVVEELHTDIEKVGRLLASEATQDTRQIEELALRLNKNANTLRKDS